MSVAKKIALALSPLPVAGPKITEFGLRRRYGAKYITPEKARNFMLAHRELTQHAIELQSLPYKLNLDTLNGCNLECPYCPTGIKTLKRKTSRLPADTAKAVIDAVKSHVIKVQLFNWGEPFLNPDIFDIIRYTSDSGIYTSISSNLSVKTKNLAERVVNSGLNHLRVSLDGTKQATLEQYRVGADFELIRKNIREIVEKRRQSGSKTPIIELYMLVFRHNEHEIPRLGPLKEELGVDAVTPCRAFIYEKEFIPNHPDFQPEQTIFRDTCDYLYTELMVEADGHVSPCCTNMNARFDIGSTADLADLRSFWNNETYQAMRRHNAGLTNGAKDGLDHLCKHCSFIGKRQPQSGVLSPLPPSMAADGAVYPRTGNRLPAGAGMS